MKDWHEECGVFGVWGHPEASNMTYLGLYSLQHRGQESAGIVSTNGNQSFVHRALGLVADVFNPEVLDRLQGEAAIGHVRYSTAGQTLIKNAQPIPMEYARGSMALAHNGNFTNAAFLRERLEWFGSIFQSNSDTEVVAHLMALAKNHDPVENFIEALVKMEGAYSILCLTENTLIAARDSFGWRPLIIGHLDDAYVFASETCAFDLIGAEVVREVEPGEVVAVDENGLRSFKPFKETPQRHCVFEHVYFARPDSHVFGRSVYQTRQAFGKVLAREHPAPDAEIVFAVPDSGLPAAMGFAKEAGLSFELGMVRNHYVGRTFIEPSQSIRNFGVKVKLNPSKDVIHGKSVVVVDDSIVRGTTMRKIIGMIRQAGATKVHVRISSPPITHSCYFGIDTPNREKLIAANMTVDQTRDYLGCDTLGYLSIDGMRSCLGGDEESYCFACFNGDYPIPVKDTEPKKQLSLFEEV